MEETKLFCSNELTELNGKEFMSVLLPRGYQDEPLCNPGVERLMLFPIVHQDLYELGNEMEQKFWLADEIDKTGDRVDFQEKLTPEQRHLMLQIFAFFASADNAVLEMLQKRVTSVITLPEAERNFSIQSHFESIHVVTYNRLIEEFVPDVKERASLFSAVKHDPVIRPKIEWLMSWATRDATLGELLAANAFFESVGFWPSFQFIFYFRKHDLLRGVCHANEKIMEDEELHVQNWSTLYRKVKNKPSDEIIYGIAQEIVDLEKSFARHALPKDMNGLSSEMMCEFIEVKTNEVCEKLGVNPLFPKASNPFSTDLQKLTGRTAQFEKQVKEYQKNLSVGDAYSLRLTSTDIDF